MGQLLIACECVTDWYTLGIHLGLTTSQLDNIRVTYHVYGLNNLKSKMFDVWLKSSSNASWADLITALKAMGEHRVASEVGAFYSPTQSNALVLWYYCVHYLALFLFQPQN